MFRKWYSAAHDVTARFWFSRRGNVAMMFAAAAVPLVVAVGGFIDLARVWAVQTQMQDAADATATMLSKNAGNLPPAQMESEATQFFLANFNAENYTTGITVTPSYTASIPSVTVDAKADMQSYFLPLVGINSVPLKTSSTVIWGQSLLRVALVLDTTGSMADDGKIAALKTATKSLLAKLKASATNDGDVYVSIIPFSKDVNVGPTNYNQAWIRWDLWDEVNGACGGKGKNPSQYTTKTSCQNAGNVWTTKNHTTWNGCVTDRDQSYDTLNTAPAAAATLFPAEQYTNCPPSPWIGLSYDWTALNNKVDALTPNGNTNQAIGLQWGWQSLTAAPFTIPPYDPSKKYQKIIILLTDGLNTEDRWFTNASQIDARERILCTNLHATDISIFTVQVNTGHDPTSQLLKDCASNSDQTFLLTSASQIVSTFDSIGTSLAQLRISR